MSNPWGELQEVYDKWLDRSADPMLLRICYGAYIANFLEGLPVWMIVLGPPSCGKTEMIMPLGESDRSHMVSSLTPSALLSGYGNAEENSLIFRLKDKILVVKDMSALTEIESESRTQIFSLLRDAFDGSIVRHTGRGEISFRGKFGILAAATDALEKGRRMEASLGERFLYVRPRISQNHQMKILERARQNVARINDLRRELNNAAQRFLNLTLPDVGKDRRLSTKTLDTIQAVSVAITNARAQVSRDHQGRIDFPVGDIGEAPTRLYHQLILLALGMKSCGAEVDEIDWSLKRVCLDTIPRMRMSILEAIADGVTRSQIPHVARMDPVYADMAIQDMLMLKVIERPVGGGSLGIANSLLDSTLKNGVRWRP